MLIFMSYWLYSLAGAPVVASFPHFYLAEDKYVDAIEGMSPDREHHQTYLDLNPVSKSSSSNNKYKQGCWYLAFTSTVTVIKRWEELYRSTS